MEAYLSLLHHSDGRLRQRRHAREPLRGKKGLHYGVASLTTCLFQWNTEAQLQVVGDQATASFDLADERLRIYRADAGDWEPGSAASIDRDDLFYRQAGHFLARVREGASPRCSFEEAAQTLRTVLAALRSSDTTGAFVET